MVRDKSMDMDFLGFGICKSRTIFAQEEQIVNCLLGYLHIYLLTATKHTGRHAQLLLPPPPPHLFHPYDKGKSSVQRAQAAKRAKLIHIIHI